jgi:DNA-directed RNA polymerase subunit RPC12/RpoP
MTTFGVGCTSRDPVTVFNPRPKHRTPAELAYIDARMEADEKWHNYTHMVDSWIANGMYQTMDEYEDLCKRLDLQEHILYKRIHCNHLEVDEMEDYLVCRNCGDKVLSRGKVGRIV